MNHRILIAGIGNIFAGDDAFGVEVIRELTQHPLPEAVFAKDFGIRSYDLAYAMMDGYSTTILVDATSRGQPPGTVYLIEPDVDAINGQTNVDAHCLNPMAVLQLVQALGGKLRKTLPRGLRARGARLRRDWPEPQRSRRCPSSRADDRIPRPSLAQRKLKRSFPSRGLEGGDSHVLLPQ